MPDEMVYWAVIAGGLTVWALAGQGRGGRGGRGGPLSCWLVRMKEGKWIRGRAWVVDGDGIWVDGREIRLLGIDAPEFLQPAVLDSGEKRNHGLLAKRELAERIGERKVTVSVEGRDRFGRILGIAWCGGEDLNRWMVASGNAVAFMHRKYRSEERRARKRRRGMWSYREAWVPVDWKHGRKRSIFRRGFPGLW